MKPGSGWIIFWAAILLLVGTPSLGQQVPRLSCEETRDRALTRVTIVSNSRVLMEEDLASLSVSLRYARQRMTRMDKEIKALRARLDKKESETDETKSSEGETKAAEAETIPGGGDTEGAKPETPAAPSDVEAGGEEPTQ